MKFRCLYLLSAVLLSAVILVIAGCSSSKNTAGTRWWKAFNAHYNTYYNGTLAYIDGSLEKENGNKDNFTELIPLYTVGNKSSRELGKSSYDRAIEKCQKAIQLQHQAQTRMGQKPQKDGARHRVVAAERIQSLSLEGLDADGTLAVL